MNSSSLPSTSSDIFGQSPHTRVRSPRWAIGAPYLRQTTCLVLTFNAGRLLLVLFELGVTAVVLVMDFTVQWAQRSSGSGLGFYLASFPGDVTQASLGAQFQRQSRNVLLWRCMANYFTAAAQLHLRVFSSKS